VSGSSVALFVAIALAGCGELHNDAPAPQPETLPELASLGEQPALLSTVAHALSVPEARYGLPYSFQLQVPSVFSTIPGEGCWRVTDGELPRGLRLDTATGFVSGRLLDGEPGHAMAQFEYAQPCGAPTGVARTAHLPIVKHGRCQWDRDCNVDEACRADGVCRAEIRDECPRFVGVELRFEPAPGADGKAPAEPLVDIPVATVEHIGFPRAASGCNPSDRELALAVPGLARSQVFCVRLPGDGDMPVRPGARVALRAWFGPHDARAVAIRALERGADSGWSWAAYTGPLRDGVAELFCSGAEACPFLSGFSAVVSSSCRLNGACDPATLGLRMPSQAKILWPGQQAPWGGSVGEKPRYSVFLARAWSEEQCEAKAMTSGLTYLVFAGAVPHPLLQVSSPDVTLDAVPLRVALDGRASLSAVQSADNASYLESFQWTLEPPLGHPRVQLSNKDPQPSFSAYLVGTYEAQLTVFDGKSKLQSPESARARIFVRPAASMHIELLWANPEVNLDLHLIPPVGAPQFAFSAPDELAEGASPAWNTGGSPIATLTAQPQAIPLEVLQLRADDAPAGQWSLALDQATSDLSLSAPVEAEVRIYAYGQRIDQGRFARVLVNPDSFIALGKFDLHDGTFDAAADATESSKQP
jgi:hypothetical protein